MLNSPITIETIGEPNSIQRIIWAELNLHRIVRSSSIYRFILKRSFFKRKSLNFLEMEQECYIWIYRSLRNFDCEKYSLLPIVHNAIKQAIQIWWKQNKYYHMFSLDIINLVDISTIEKIIKEERIDILNRHINSFSLKEKELIYRRFIENESLKKITYECFSKTFKKPSRTYVHWKIKSLLEKLKYKLESYERN